MAVSEKQKIYLDMMRLILPMARNVQTWGWLRRARTNLYPELELIHGLPLLMQNPDFSTQDIYWINIQGVNFVNYYKNVKHRFHSIEIVEIIYRLVVLVPPEFEADLAEGLRSESIARIE